MKDLAKELIGFKTLFLDSAANISDAEIGVFMLCILIFMFFAFIGVLFWAKKPIFFVTSLICLSILFATPFSVAYVIRNFIHPILVTNAEFHPLTFTSGFSYNATITNKSKKLSIQSCTITAYAKRNETNELNKIKNLFLPLNPVTKTIKINIPPLKSAQISGIIDGYKEADKDFVTILDCH